MTKHACVLSRDYPGAALCTTKFFGLTIVYVGYVVVKVAGRLEVSRETQLPFTMMISSAKGGGVVHLV